ncbi:hypothetical protein MKX08_006097 [Trichoderma sp. CBMAI-0020]|nr:hypothetical protein MKX08_006097 [Trichoderma sp. CBMAI-0020]
MAPAPDQLSSPGSVSYDSDTMVVGDGTWDFTKNTFLLPNLQGTDFDTMRYNGMGNRFSTVHQYHTIILAHGIMAAMVFLFLVPLSVMLARFYTREPAHAMRYHARLGVFSGLLLVAAFILPFFAVGPNRSLSNPHHGIGVAIFVMFVVQLVGGRLIQHIMNRRSLRVTLHNWLGRAAALLGIIQVPLGLTLYGSPKVLFILYAVWMGFLLAVYFVLDYRTERHHERYIPAGRSEAGNTRITESEHYSEHREHENSPLKWLGPLAAGAGIFALMRGRKKEHDDDRSRARTRSPSMSRSRGPTVISSRPSYFSEKYSDLPAQRSGGGGFFGKALGGAAAAFGAGKVFSNFMDRRDRRDEEYSAVSTETPHRNRSIRAATVSEFNSEYTDDVSTIPPSRHPAPTQTASAYGGRNSSPRRSNVRSNISRGDMMDESEYSSYVSPSRRPRDEPSGGGGGGFAKGVLATLGVGWFAKKFADRRARKEEEDRLREEEEMRSGTQFSSRYSNTEYQSPVRRDSRRPPQRRSTVTGTEYSDGTESTFDTQTELSTMPPKGPRNTAAGVRPSTSALTSDEMSSQPRRGERLSMPTMPSDPHGILHRAEVESDVTSLADRPQGRHSSRRQMDSERAAAEAAARASSLAAREQRGRGGSSLASGPARPRDDKEHVRLRKVTEEETLAQTSRGRRDSQSSLSALESPTKNRRYRRDDSKRRAESAAESRVESSRVGSSRVQDDASRLAPLNPPNPSLAKGRRGRDSGYNSGQPPAQQSGQPGPSFLQPPGQHLPNPSITSVGSHGTWSGMESEVPTEVPTAPRNPPQSTPHQPPPAEDKGNESAADNRRRRRAERRRASGSRPSGTENTYDTSTYDENDMF